MNDGNLSRPVWDGCTREELLAELARLRAENIWLTALLPFAAPVRGNAEQPNLNDSSKAVRNASTPHFRHCRRCSSPEPVPELH